MLKDKQMPHEISPLMLKLNAARDVGYDKDFEFEDGGLKCMQTGKVYDEKDVVIIDHFRFEGISDPDDMEILYLVSTEDGMKGVIIDAFGIYANSELFDFMKNVKDDTKKSL